MNFLISLVTAILLVAVGRNFIKKHANICYIISAIISLGLVIGSFTGALYSLPSWFSLTVLPLLMKSSFATALFVIVMYTGAFKNGGKLIKYLMPIRAELSIIASILTLAHNITFGRYHFVMLFTSPENMSLNMRFAAIISIIMILIMLPLFVTSFSKVRKSMNPRKWRKLQKLAYLFYGLTYLHVMLIMMPVAKSGNTTYIINVLVYSIVYLTYGAMRLSKYFSKKNFSKYIIASPIVASVLSLAVVSGVVFYNPTTIIEDNETVVESASDEVDEIEDDTEDNNEDKENTSQADTSNSSNSSTSNSSNSSSTNKPSTNSSTQNTTSSTGNSSSSSTSKPVNNSSSSNPSSSNTDNNSGGSSNTGSSSNSENSSINNNLDSSTSNSTSNEENASNDAVSGATQHTTE